jgi:hypothetical protein
MRSYYNWPKFNSAIIYSILALILLLQTSCNDADFEDPFLFEETSYSPIIIAVEDLPSLINFETERKLETTGKIYSYGNFILINEKYEGIHFFDNTNPRQPNKIGFISIPGCVDMAVKEGILYADNAVDLIAIDITSFPIIEVKKRVSNIFPELTPPDLQFVPYKYSIGQRPDNTVIINWELK